MTPKRRRNPLRLIIDKEIQLRILGLVGSAVFLSVLLEGILLAFKLHWLWCAVLVTGFGIFVSLYVSRYITGPLYRIEQDLEDWMQGALEGRAINLRKGDSMQRLALLINKLIERTR